MLNAYRSQCWKPSTNGVADPEHLSPNHRSRSEMSSDFGEMNMDMKPAPTQLPPRRKQHKLLARWMDITNQHRLALRYNYKKNISWIYPMQPLWRGYVFGGQNV